MYANIFAENLRGAFAFPMQKLPLLFSAKYNGVQLCTVRLKSVACRLLTTSLVLNKWAKYFNSVLSASKRTFY